MSDINAQLPVRTEVTGQVNGNDFIAKIGDGTLATQLLGVDSSGRITMKLNDGAGNSITEGQKLMAASLPVVLASDQSTINVKDTADGPVAPGAVAANSQLAGGQFNTVLPTLTNGQQAAMQLDASGRLIVASQTINDTNYGVVGANTLRTAAEIGNATGAADFNAGATTAQTLRTNANQGVPNTIANGWPVKPTDGTNSQAYTAAGAAKMDIEQIVGATPSATNALPTQIATAGAFVSGTNPLPVTISSDRPGTEINDYNTAAAIAAGATSNHDYTVTAAKTLSLNQIHATASGKMKMEIQVETGAATGVFTTKFVGFNSTSTPNMDISVASPIQVAAGVRVRVIRTNKDLLPQDMYSTISGNEI